MPSHEPGAFESAVHAEPAVPGLHGTSCELQAEHPSPSCACFLRLSGVALSEAGKPHSPVAAVAVQERDQLEGPSEPSSGNAPEFQAGWSSCPAASCAPPGGKLARPLLQQLWRRLGSWR